MHDSIKDFLKAESIVCGIKQVKKTIQEGTVKKLYIASDADRRLTAPIVKMAENSSVPVVWVASMHILVKCAG